MNTSVFCQETQISRGTFLRIPLLAGNLEGQGRFGGALGQKKSSLLNLLNIMVRGKHFDNNSSISRSELKRLTGLSDTTIYYRTKNLERLGLLKSINGPEDSRKKKYYLLNDIKEIVRLVPELKRDTLTNLSAKDLLAISRRLELCIRLKDSTDKLKAFALSMRNFCHDRRDLIAFIELQAKMLTEEEFYKNQTPRVAKFVEVLIEMTNKLIAGMDSMHNLYDPIVEIGRAHV